MRKRNFSKIILPFIILALILFISNTFATDGTAIVIISNEKVSPNENFYLILNLSAISFNKFQVDITNSQNLTTTETTGIVQELSSNNVVTTFVIDKNQINLEKLGVIYTAPNVEGIVKFNVKITSLENTEEALTEQITNLTTEIESLQTAYTNLLASMEKEQDTNSETYIEAQSTANELNNTITSKTAEKDKLDTSLKNYQTPTIFAVAEIQISKIEEKSQNISIEDNKSLNQNSINEENMKSDMLNKDNLNNFVDKNMLDLENMEKMENMKDKMKEMEDMSEKMKNQMGSLETSLKMATDTISSLSKDTTYQGSPNNYLSVLLVQGYDLNNDFDKTTNNYFISVDSNIKKLNIIATPEDSTATVTIYGNTDLETGQNKIIINVTAQDGSVRTYRIYVTK